VNQGPTNKKRVKPPRVPSEAAVDATPVQVVSRGMSFWFLLLAIGLSGLFGSSLYFGLFVVASTFGSVLLVSITLYVFFKYWPEDEALKPLPRRVEAPPSPEPRKAVIQVVQVDGPPKTRFMMALRDASQRQDSFKISKEGAERFAKTIRYLLENS
jgi:hypothetical protein